MWFRHRVIPQKDVTPRPSWAKTRLLTPGWTLRCSSLWYTTLSFFWLNVLSLSLSPSVHSDVTNTSSTETGWSSANRFSPTPSLQSMEVSSQTWGRRDGWRKLSSGGLNVHYLSLSAPPPLQRPWPWRDWPWTVWGRRKRPTTWWGEACAMTSRATSVSLFMSRHMCNVCVGAGDVLLVKLLSL